MNKGHWSAQDELKRVSLTLRGVAGQTSDRKSMLKSVDIPVHSEGRSGVASVKIISKGEREQTTMTRVQELISIGSERPQTSSDKFRLNLPEKEYPDSRITVSATLALAPAYRPGVGGFIVVDAAAFQTRVFRYM